MPSEVEPPAAADVAEPVTLTSLQNIGEDQNVELSAPNVTERVPNTDHAAPVEQPANVQAPPVADVATEETEEPEHQEETDPVVGSSQTIVLEPANGTAIKAPAPVVVPRDAKDVSVEPLRHAEEKPISESVDSQAPPSNTLAATEVEEAEEPEHEVEADVIVRASGAIVTPTEEIAVERLAPIVGSHAEVEKESITEPLAPADPTAIEGTEAVTGPTDDVTPLALTEQPAVEPVDGQALPPVMAAATEDEIEGPYHQTRGTIVQVHEPLISDLSEQVLADSPSSVAEPDVKEEGAAVETAAPSDATSREETEPTHFSAFDQSTFEPAHIQVPPTVAAAATEEEDIKPEHQLQAETIQAQEPAISDPTTEATAGALASAPAIEPHPEEPVAEPPTAAEMTRTVEVEAEADSGHDIGHSTTDEHEKTPSSDTNTFPAPPTEDVAASVQGDFPHGSTVYVSNFTNYSNRCSNCLRVN